MVGPAAATCLPQVLFTTGGSMSPQARAVPLPHTPSFYSLLTFVFTKATPGGLMAQRVGKNDVWRTTSHITVCAQPREAVQRQKALKG